MRTIHSLWSVSISAILMFASGVARGASDDEAFHKPAPQNAADLRTMEQQVTAVAEKAVACTVALQVGRAQASGVVVSPDGYILTAAHVIERPGRNVTVTFPDGTTAPGQTLGLNPQVDGGLVRITSGGPWPFVPIAPADETPKPGDWCLATGHPGGFQPGRKPPVRLGRIINSDPGVIRTDCTISMGDSGGPLFDMQCRVIGIHSRISEEMSMNLHVPAATYQEAWDVLKSGEITQRHSRFLARFDADGDGKIVRAEIPERYRQVFDRLAIKLQLDPDKPYDIDELSKSLGLDAPRSLDIRQLPSPARVVRLNSSLAPERFARGSAVRSAFAEIVAQTRQSTVRVRCNTDDVAFGTIVGSDGSIVTKASQLIDANKIFCVMPDHREFPARLVGVEASYDLALLHVDAGELKAVTLSTPDLRSGMWLASPGLAPEPVTVGIVSNAERAIGRSPPVLGVLIDDRAGSTSVQQVMSGSGAAIAGVKVGDVITHISRESVHTMAELQTAVRKYRVGDVVEAAIERGGMKLEVTVRLGMQQDAFSEDLRPGRGGESPTPSWRGSLSQRRDDFPVVIQHDSVLKPTDCGGPVVDSAGEVIGINIARADRTASYALPSSTVQTLVAKLQSGK